MRWIRSFATVVVLGLIVLIGATGAGSVSEGPAAEWEKDHRIAAKAWNYAEKNWPNHFSGTWGVRRKQFHYDFVFAFTSRPAVKVRKLRKMFPTGIAKYLPARRTYSYKYLDGLLTQLITDRRRILNGRLKPPGPKPGRFDLGLNPKQNRVVVYKPFFARGYKKWFKRRYGRAMIFVKSGLGQWG